MKKYQTMSAIILLTLVFVGVATFFAPHEVSAFWVPGDSVVSCNGTTIPCDFNALILLIQNVISFLLWFAAPVATLLFSYAGFLYLTAGGSPHNIEKAHSIFKDVIWGVVIMLSAFLVVYLITDQLLSDEYKASSNLQLQQLSN